MTAHLYGISGAEVTTQPGSPNPRITASLSQDSTGYKLDPTENACDLMRRVSMSNIAVVQRLMDRILVQDFDRALSVLAKDVELTVLPAPASSGWAEIRRGRQAVREYFSRLGGIVTFWQVRFVAHGDQVLVPGREQYVTRCGLTSDSDFMLSCQVRDGKVARIVVVED